MSYLLALAIWAAAAAGAGKLPPPLAKEIADAIVAVDKALGLESWPSHGVKPCVDQGGPDNPTKTVGAEETKKCANAAVAKGFPQLGKTYVLAVLMAPVGPSTVIAIGTGEAAGWGAYSCDPKRPKCPPTKMVASSKWGKRLLDRQARACKEAGTIWLPEGQRSCP
jgi:hypothetical protein